jgi:hypothetical protein
MWPGYIKIKDMGITPTLYLAPFYLAHFRRGFLSKMTCCTFFFGISFSGVGGQRTRAQNHCGPSMSKKRTTVVSPRFTERRFRPYTTAIGEATLAWNDLHENLGVLFGESFEGSKVITTLEIWNALTNDRSKREILKAAAETSRYADLTENVIWLVARCQELEDDRNNAIHSPLWAPYIPGTNTRHVKPASESGNRRAARLATKDILKEYYRVRDTAALLRDYCAGISLTLFNLRIGFQPSSWPDRPKLPDRAGSKIR